MPDIEPVGTVTTFRTDEDLNLAVHLLQAALVRVLTGRWSFQLRRFAPPTFVSRRPGRNLLAKALHGAAATTDCTFPAVHREHPSQQAGRELHAPFAYIDGWYNTRRVQAGLGDRSPDEYEAAWYAANIDQPDPSGTTLEPAGAR